MIRWCTGGAPLLDQQGYTGVEELCCCPVYIVSVFNCFAHMMTDRPVLGDIVVANYITVTTEVKAIICLFV